MRSGDRRTLIGLVVVALAVSIAAWLLESTVDSRADDVATQDAAQAAADLPASDAPRLDESAAAPKVLASGAPAPTADGPVSLGEALRFTGRVVDEAGQPVAGALITHWPTLAMRQELELPRFLGWGDFAWERLTATRTDPAGRFVLDVHDVPPDRTDSVAIEGGPWTSYEMTVDLWPHLLVEHEGFATADLQIATANQGTSEVGEIVLSAGVVLSGRLVDGQGASVAGAEVSARTPEHAEQGSQELGDLEKLRLSTRTDEAGRFRLGGLSVAPWDLTGEPAGFSPFSQPARPQQPGPLDVGEIRLVPGASLAGQVLDERGAPLAGAEVVVRMMLPMDGARGPDRAAAAWGMRQRTGDRFFEPRVRTLADGSFVVPGLWSQMDAFRVTACAPGFDPATVDDVKPGAKDVTLALEPQASWRVQVADAVDQRPVEGVKLEATRPVKDSESDWAGDVEVLAEADGWQLRGAGRWRTDVTVSAPGHAKTKFTLEGLGAGETRSQQLLLPRELLLEGRVLDESGAPLPGAKLALKPEWSSHFLGTRATRTTADGRFRFAQLAPATWTLTASAPGHIGLRRPREIALAADAPPAPIELVLPLAGRIEGELRDAAGRAVARGHVAATSQEPAVALALLRSEDGKPVEPSALPDGVSAEALSGPDGHFALDGLPAGRWELDGGLGAKAAVQVTAGETAQAQLVRRPPARVEGRVTLGGAPLPGVRVELNYADAFQYGWYPMDATRTDESGHYELSRDHDGKFALLATDGEAQTEPAFVTLALDSVVHADLAFGAGRIAGRVTLAGEGTPLAGVSLLFTRRFGADDGRLERNARSDADGRFVLERLPPGTWTVAAFAGLLVAPRLPDVQVTAGETSELAIEMSRAGDMELTLADPERWGQLVMVELLPLAGQEPKLETFVPGQHAGLGPLQVGDYTLNLKRLEDSGWVLAQSRRVTIAAGETLKLRIEE